MDEIRLTPPLMVRPLAAGWPVPPSPRLENEIDPVRSSGMHPVEENLSSLPAASTVNRLDVQQGEGVLGPGELML